MSARAITARLSILAVILAGGLTAAQATEAQTPVALTFVTLGTGGGPRVQVNRSQPANAVIVGESVYLFDVGEGTQRQLKAAGIEPARIRGVFLSHHHVDHVGGLWTLLVTRWIEGRYDPLPIYGPPGTVRMVEALVAAARPMELAPVALGPALPPIGSTVKPMDLAADLSTPRLALDDGKVRVLAVLNDHYHFPEGSASAREARSYAFRVEAGGASVVYSGDTGPSPRLEALARNADMLVSEVMDLEAIQRSLAGASMSAALREGVLKHVALSHLTPGEVGAMARRANVRSLVLTHLVPGLDGEPNDNGYLAGLPDVFRGPVVVARDGQAFPLPLSTKTGD